LLSETHAARTCSLQDGKQRLKNHYILKNQGNVNDRYAHVQSQTKPVHAAL